DIVATHLEPNPQVGQLCNVAPYQGWPSGIDLLANPRPSFSGIVGREHLDLCAQSMGEIYFEIGVSPYQIKRWDEVARAQVGQAKRPPEGEDETFLGRFSPVEALPVQKVSHRG
ncbi:MAG TPA: hypothetical protein PKD07_20170, partial [Microthrixaceae bacterium]|nr:hypothetical protein [Microthrixaceae bacterium]